MATEITVNETTLDVTVTVSNERGPAGANGPNSVTSATTSDGTADLSVHGIQASDEIGAASLYGTDINGVNLAVDNATLGAASVLGTLTAEHIHGNLAGSLYMHVRAGENLSKGDPVYVSGSHGSGPTMIPIVSRADASDPAKMPAIAIMDAAVSANANGHAVISGTITDFNTNAYTVNATLYVANGGGLTATKPTNVQPVARVERVNTNNGGIVVKVNGLYSDISPANIGAVATTDPRLSDARPTTAAHIDTALQTATETQEESIRNSLALAQPVEFGHRINSQPNTMVRLRNYGLGGGGSGSAPIRITSWGDSFLAGVAPPFNASLSGRFGFQPSTTTGTVTTQSTASSRWINRVTYTCAAGSSAILSWGGAASNWDQGDRCAIAYIRTPGGGSFDFQYESSLNPGTWVTLANINTANATEAGGYNEYSLPTTNLPFFRLRVANVTAGPVVLVTAGVYNSDGGGVIWMPFSAATGMSPSEVTVPDAILTPIWAGLAPDVVLTSWLESGGNEWRAGGGFRSIYDRTKAVRAATDWIMIGPHYTQSNPPLADVDDQVLAMREFALEKNETFFDSRPMFRTWAESNTLGLMADSQHLSISGQLLRNSHLWHTLPMGRFPLGTQHNAADWSFPLAGAGTDPAVIQNKSYTVNRPLHVRDSSNSGLVVWDQLGAPFDFRRTARLRSQVSSDPHGLQEVQIGSGGYQFLLSSQIAKFTVGLALATPTTLTATGSVFRGSTTVLCNASSGNMTVNLGHTAADSPGRIHIIKKTDSSANTVTIDPAGSETIDGATTHVLTTQNQSIMIQSTGTNWVILARL